MRIQGFTLLEMLIALAMGSLLMLGAARLLPLIQMENLRQVMRAQLDDELQQIMQVVEKAVRRAGYCHGECRGAGLLAGRSDGSCLLLRWDENSNGQWESPGRDDSDYYGYRLRAGSLEMQRGVDSCDGSGWERLNDPRTVGISDFRIERRAQRIKITLSGFARLLPSVALSIHHWQTAENL